MSIVINPLHEWYQRFDDVENLSFDLSLAAKMGEEFHRAQHSALHAFRTDQYRHAEGAVKSSVRMFCWSSWYVYHGDMQKILEAPSLKEADACRPSWKMAMDGKMFFLSACVRTSGKILVSRICGAFSNRLRTLGWLVRRGGESSGGCQPRESFAFGPWPERLLRFRGHISAIFCMSSRPEACR